MVHQVRTSLKYVASKDQKEFMRDLNPVYQAANKSLTIEGYHRQIRKVTKTKGAFTSDMALLKLMYLETVNIEKNGHSHW